MSVPPRLQLLIDALGEKVKRANDPQAREQPPLASSSPSRAINGAVDPPREHQAPASPKAVHGSSVPLRPNHDRLPTPQRVVTAQALVEELTVSLKTEFHPTTLRIYQTLVHLAIEVAKARGYSPNVSQVTYHVPAEVVASELGMHRITLWRNLKLLVARGLIDHRPHKTTVDGQTCNDGTLWAIRLSPIKGKRARLSYDDLKHAWRDLEADIRTGRTTYNFVMQQSKDPGRVITRLLQ